MSTSNNPQVAAALLALATALGTGAAPVKEKTPEELAQEKDFLARVAVAEAERRKKILAAARLKAPTVVDPDMPAGIAGGVLMAMADRMSYTYNRQRNFLEYLASQRDIEYSKGTDRDADLHPNVDSNSTGEHTGMLDTRTQVESIETRMAQIQDELDLLEVYGEATTIRLHACNMEIVDTTNREAPFRPKFDISDRAYQAFLTQDRTRRMTQREERASASRQGSDILRRTTTGSSVDRIISQAA